MLHFQLTIFADFGVWARFRNELYGDLEPEQMETEIKRITSDPALCSYLVFSEKDEAVRQMVLPVFV